MQPLSTCIRSALCPLCSEYLSSSLHWGGVTRWTRIFHPWLWAPCKNQRFHFTSLAFPSPRDVLGVGHRSVARSYPPRTTPALPLLFYLSALALSCTTLEALTFRRAREIEGDFKLSAFLAKISIGLVLIKSVNPFFKYKVYNQTFWVSMVQIFGTDIEKWYLAIWAFHFNKLHAIRISSFPLCQPE